MKRFLSNLIFFFFFLPSFFGYASENSLNTGDIIFAKYNNYFDYGISIYFKKKYSHTLIMTDRGAFSFSVMYIGDKGSVYKDEDIFHGKDHLLILRPIFNDKEQYDVYKKCVNNYTEILSNKIAERKILFDWNLENKKNSYICNTFVFHILMKCLPDYTNYFVIDKPDKIHYNDKKPVIYFDKALNLKKFKIIYKF
jgi:hypothetical protein